MSLIIFILLGALVGYVAARILGRREGFIASAIIGIIGSLIGSFISHLTTGADRAYLTLDASSLLWSLGGALVLVALLNHFTVGRTKV